MGRIKTALSEIKSGAIETAVKFQTGELTLTRSDRILFIVMATATMLFFAVTQTFAADLFDAIGSKFWEYYLKFAGLATIVALLAITTGLLWIMLSPSSKSSATPISWIKKVFLCYFLLMVIGGVFGVINDLTKGYGGEILK